MAKDTFEIKRASEVKPGDPATYIKGHHPGAIANGRRIVKVWSEPGDANPVGTEGVVVSSVGHPTLGIGYFVVWDTMPDRPVFVVGKKIEAK